MTWAGATGTSPCNGAVSSGTLTSAYYSQAYSYDAQGRLSSGAIGSYVYGDASHPHAVTAIGGGTYTASYDAVGDMQCRAPNSSVTCAGTPTGATMSYDAERRLADWQNTPTTPTVQAASLYDGEGNRIEQWVNTSGVQTTTGYLLGGLEERTNAGVITKYLGAKGLPTAMRVGTAGSLNYLTTDGLGSVSVAVDGSGTVVASQLYAPYGASRYTNGTMPTSMGFTGQRADVTSGLDYYGARYYDPVAGQFTSADSVSQGLSRYNYVGSNPETATDPSGHLACSASCGGPVGGNPCLNGPADCIAIHRTFGNSNTIAALMLLDTTSIGAQFVAFLLAVGAKLGDAYIQWTDSPGGISGAGGYTTSGGYIQLNPNLLSDTNLAKPGSETTYGEVEAAQALIHEAVESFYAIEYGQRFQASQHMDYVAQWFTGEFESQYFGGNTREGGTTCAPGGQVRNRL